MKRAAIYARFSTDLQDEKSVEDQIALCREYAQRNSLAVVETFEDKARSGASILNRDGLLQMMERAKNGAFDVLVTEALDRLSRDMEDLAGIHKRLTFRGIEIRAVHEGKVDTVLVGLRGLVGQLYREDNAKKVRRGMAGVIRSNRHAGGRAFGYAPIPGERGRLAVTEAEARVVLRIFTEYAAGKTPREIAHSLNREGIAPPRGRAWNASTINGNGLRGSGILRNELYVGRIVWNKVRMVKDPDTGKRVSRSNPQEEWQIASAPELAIVPTELFEAAQQRAAERRTTHAWRQRRPRRILSGLLKCAACGSGMSTYGKDKSGRHRIRCTAAAENGTCPDPVTFYIDTVERAVLSGLKAELRHPDVIAEWVRTYQAERRRLASQQDAGRSRAKRRLGELTREIDRLVDAIAKGHGDASVLGPRSTSLAKEKSALEGKLSETPVPIVGLHPAALKRYEEQIRRLQASLTKGIQNGDAEATQAIRDLIDTVTVHRDLSKPGGVEVVVAGRLNALLGNDAFPNGIKGSWVPFLREG
jgi:site-specific DNA recombinase